MRKPPFAVGIPDWRDVKVLLEALLLAVSRGAAARSLSPASERTNAATADKFKRHECAFSHVYLAVALLFASIYGCGGGEATAEEIAATPPPNTQPVRCSTTPAVCR